MVRKIVGYAIIVAEPKMGESLASEVMRFVERNHRGWEILNGPFVVGVVPDHLLCQAFVDYEEEI